MSRDSYSVSESFHQQVLADARAVPRVPGSGYRQAKPTDPKAVEPGPHFA